RSRILPPRADRWPPHTVRQKSGSHRPAPPPDQPPAVLPVISAPLTRSCPPHPRGSSRRSPEGRRRIPACGSQQPLIHLSQSGYRASSRPGFPHNLPAVLPPVPAPSHSYLVLSQGAQTLL